MMKSKLFAGLVAFGIYFAVLAALFYYFGYHHRNPPRHYVVKNERGIAVTLAGAKAPNPPSPKKKTTAKKKHHPKPRNIAQEKKAPRTVPTRRKKTTRQTPKRPDTKKLFSKVKVPQKQTQKKGGASGTKQSPQHSLKKQSKERGIENAYLAKVERLLKGWPAQANFAGEEIDIRLTIYPDGRFDYKILKLSGNPDFNHALIGYLRQLQNLGFGPHPGKRAYDVEVRFVAHE